MIRAYDDYDEKTCLDCKFHMFSDMYLECCKHIRINNQEICDDFEGLEGETE